MYFQYSVDFSGNPWGKKRCFSQMIPSHPLCLSVPAVRIDRILFMSITLEGRIASQEEGIPVPIGVRPCGIHIVPDSIQLHLVPLVSFAIVFPIPANNWPLTPPICFGTPPPLPANRFRPPPRCWTPSPINFPPWSSFMPLWNRSTPPSKPTPPLLRKAQRPTSSCTPSPPLWSSM